MTTIDNSKIFLGGIYGDASVYVAANTTYTVGTVLGLNKSGNLVAYSTDLDNGYTPASGDTEAVQAFESEPTYILAQELKNTTSAAVTSTMVRVFESGDVDASKLVFVKTADKTSSKVLTKMKNNGFNLVNVEQMA